MRIRSLTILATSTLAALLGCPLDSLQGTAEPAATGDSNGSGLIANNTASHDDRVDAADDVSWVPENQLPSGKSALRVLMTDAPIDADNVFVTFCGIQVHAAGAAMAGDARDATDAGRPHEARGERAESGAGGAAGAGAAPGSGGASSDGRSSDGPPGAGGAGAAPPDAADRPSDADPTDPAGAGGRAGDDDGSKPVEGAERDEAARTEAERARAEAERAEAERAEAERAEAERDPSGAERPDGTSAGGRSSDSASPEDIATREGDGAGNWLTISEGCQTVDLLTLRDGVTEAIGATTLPPGNYGQIRLMLVDASIVAGGVEQELTLPSGTESGLKIVGGFTLRDGLATTITLDFDAGRSIHHAPGTGFMMTPVIDLIDVTVHGDAGDDVSEGDSAKPRDDGRDGAPGAAGAGGRAGAGGTGAGGARSDSPPRAEAGPRPEATPPADKDPRPGAPPPPEAPPAEGEPDADDTMPADDDAGE